MIYRYTINNAFKETEKLDVFFKLVYGEIYILFFQWLKSTIIEILLKKIYEFN